MNPITHAIRVTRQAGTERAWTSPLNDNKKAGVYKCTCCDTPLFDIDEVSRLGKGLCVDGAAIVWAVIVGTEIPGLDGDILSSEDDLDVVVLVLRPIWCVDRNSSDVLPESLGRGSVVFDLSRVHIVRAIGVVITGHCSDADGTTGGECHSKKEAKEDEGSVHLGVWKNVGI